MSEWKNDKIDNVVLINPETLSSKSKLTYINYLDTGNITKGKIDNLQKFNLEIETPPSRAKRIVKLNDIIYSTVRPAHEHYGFINNSIDNLIVSTGFAVLRPKQDLINGKFLYYYLTLSEIIDYLSNVAEDSTSAYPSIKPEIIADLDLSYPSLPEQEQIAEILSSLDDKIDLLHRQNKTLESLAETYFRQWFIEEAQPNWEEKGLDEIGNFLNGLALQKFPYSSGEPLKVIKIKELNNGFSDATELCSSILNEKYIVNNGDVIFSWSGSLELAIWKYGKGALNQHLFKVTSKKHPKWFYYYWIKKHLDEFRIIASDKATTMGHIQRHHLHEAKVLVPDEISIVKMNNVMCPILKKLELNNSQVQTLTSLRNTLLPKLISGEVRIKMEV